MKIDQYEDKATNREPDNLSSHKRRKNVSVHESKGSKFRVHRKSKPLVSEF